MRPASSSLPRPPPSPPTLSTSLPLPPPPHPDPTRNARTRLTSRHMRPRRASSAGESVERYRRPTVLPQRPEAGGTPAAPPPPGCAVHTAAGPGQRRGWYEQPESGASSEAWHRTGGGSASASASVAMEGFGIGFGPASPRTTRPSASTSAWGRGTGNRRQRHRRRRRSFAVGEEASHQRPAPHSSLLAVRPDVSPSGAPHDAQRYTTRGALGSLGSTTGEGPS